MAAIREASQPSSSSDVADVIIVGSGAAGLTAALIAADRGARVIVLEKTDWIGGASAISGGTIWLPANRLAREAGYADTPEAALRYLLAGGGETVNEALLQSFTATADEALHALEAAGVLFALGKDTDYRPELPGGLLIGRSLIPKAFDPSQLGAWAAQVRHAHFPLDMAEIYGSLNAAAHDAHSGAAKGERWTRGRALVGALLAACLARGVVIETGRRARQLIQEDDGVCGVVTESEDGANEYRAQQVVLASGGFEWDAELVNAFLRAPIEAPASPPAMEGDGLRMAMSVGAALGSMAEAWWSPTIRIPGETYDGQPYSRMAVSQRLYPRSIMVDRSGRRFMNEAQNYHDAGGALMAVEHSKGGRGNTPCWLVIDSGYRRRYGVACVLPADADPNWLSPFPTLEALATANGIDPSGLIETVRRFNADAETGHDSAFGRGNSEYALSKGDRKEQGIARTLAPLVDPPFYAVRLHAGTIGTRGGPVTDADGRVRDIWGHSIPGLFAAGNVAAAPTGLLYPGAGGTLGLAITFGYRIGQALLHAEAPQ
jgi:succinate dehydrogenase/fumarate reductase flavoprotein subunit